MDDCSLFWSRQGSHGVDLAEQLVGGLLSLVRSNRSGCFASVSMSSSRSSLYPFMALAACAGHDADALVEGF